MKTKPERISTRNTSAFSLSPKLRPALFLAAASIFLPSLPLAALGSQAKSAQRKSTRPAQAAATKECGNGVTLALTAPAAPQGGLLLLSVSGTAPINDLKANWGDKPLPFWEDAKHVQHALLGVDLERAPGKYDLDISSETQGDKLSCSATVDVRVGHFAIESLKVAPGFVELSPEDRARADKESQRTHEIFAQVTPERLWTGKFRIPLTRNRSGHNFGKRRVLNGQASAPHTGLDIPAPAGTPIHASQRGRVVLADNLFFSGNTVIVDHGLGVYTFYGHMKSVNVAEGDEVNAGTVLGLVGATGRATGPHLHWSLVVNGARVNPLSIVNLQLQ